MVIKLILDKFSTLDFSMAEVYFKPLRVSAVVKFNAEWFVDGVQSFLKITCLQRAIPWYVERDMQA